MRLFQQLPIPLPVALGGTGNAAGVWAATSLAINGATLGTDKLAIIGNLGITGTINLTGAVTSGGNFLTYSPTGAFRWNTKSRISSPVDGSILLQNDAAASFSLLQFGGTDATKPALKVNGTGLSVRLADDSADTALTAANLNVTGSAIPANGLSLSAANQLSLSSNGFIRFSLNSAGNFVSANASGAYISLANASGTVPTFAPNRSDTTSGLGGATSAPALIAGGASIATFEAAKITNTVPSRDLTTTVGSLPSAATIGQGYRAFVTDALTPVFGSAVTGGGAVNVPVYSNGANWIVG